MDSGDGGSGMGFPHEGGESAINPMSSMPLHTSNASGSLFTSGWDPISSLTQSQTFGCSPSISNHQFLNYPYPSSSIWENQGISSSSCTPQLPHYQPESNFVGFPGYVNRGYSEIANSICPMNYDGGSQARASISQELKSTEEEAIRSPSNARRRKRTPDKNNEGDLRKDPSGDTSDVPKEQNKKKQRTEPAESADSRGKQSTKQAKEDSNSGGDEQPKEENYIHMRARRGQATNSHSLAERVRREKISERMRLLQDLVPGCNKITGKAVMLDEIINYVQSLQQQVEFLSMKLSTLVPDLSNNNNLESILSKEVLQLQSLGRDAILHGLGPGAGPSLPYGQGIFHAALNGVSSMNQYPSLPRAPLDTELQTLLQMGFDSSAAIDILKTNARLKSEQ